MRKRNGIKKVLTTIRLDEDIHTWIKDTHRNFSMMVNYILRKQMEEWKEMKTKLDL